MNLEITIFGSKNFEFPRAPSELLLPSAKEFAQKG